MNENITEVLNKYVKNPDPQYAIMLKGKWGCGKSYFISNWIDEYKKSPIAENTTLEPIYVSLYGLRSINQIKSAIDRVVHPMLYSKGAEIMKNLLKVAGKLVFKTSIDWTGDGKEDISLDGTLDSLSLLSSKIKEVLGTKLIIFDDLERCQMNMKCLLGFINGFVEHGGCHVIIVGDETHACEQTKKILAEFKEKTVGRELEVHPDIAAAIDYFVKGDIPLTQWYSDKLGFITDIFNATQCNNLRLLRQCLYDFSTLYNEVSNGLLEKDEIFMKGLLCSYIVVYCEYPGEYHDILDEWDWSYFNGISGNELTKEKISKLQSKYRKVSTESQIEALNISHVPEIVKEIKTGYSLKIYVESCLKQMQRELTVQDKLVDFYNLKSKKLDVLCKRLVKEIINNKIKNQYLLGRSIAILAFFDKEHIYRMPQSAVSLAKQHISDLYHSATNQEELYTYRENFMKGVASFMDFHKSWICSDVLDFLNKAFDECMMRIPNRLEKVLNSLNNKNVQNLLTLSKEVSPDKQCTYNMTSVFKNINPSEFATRVLGLNNNSMNILRQFFSIHYSFYVVFSSGCKFYADDLDFLTNLKDKLLIALAKRKGIDKYVLGQLIKYVNGAKRRAEGEQQGIFLDE